MALKKKITMPNGLPLEYHRISLVNIQHLMEKQNKRKKFSL